MCRFSEYGLKIVDLIFTVWRRDRQGQTDKEYGVMIFLVLCVHFTYTVATDRTGKLITLEVEWVTFCTLNEKIYTLSSRLQIHFSSGHLFHWADFLSQHLFGLTGQQSQCLECRTFSELYSRKWPLSVTVILNNLRCDIEVIQLTESLLIRLPSFKQVHHSKHLHHLSLYWTSIPTQCSIEVI